MLLSTLTCLGFKDPYHQVFFGKTIKKIILKENLKALLLQNIFPV